MSRGAALDMPVDLRCELDRRGATLAWHRIEGPRTYARFALAEGGELFGWWSTDPREHPMVDREEKVRAAVGACGPLRSPALLARGQSWRLERFIVSDPLCGPEAVATAVAAAARVADLVLPESTSMTRERRVHALSRRGRVLASPLSAAAYLRGHALYRSSTLPRVMSHGDFHPIHLLYDAGEQAVWVIDWDLAAERPAGFDLMQLWCYLEPPDRERCFEGAVGLFGERNRRALAELRYAVLTRMIASNFAERHKVNRNPVEGRRLLALMPEVAAAAGVS